MSTGEHRAEYHRRIAAVLRAVADDPGLPVTFDARSPGLDTRGAHLPGLSGPPDRTSWLDWRVLGDRLGALHRHPPPLRVPLLDAGRQAVFDALWQARAEVLLGRELPGVRRNFEAWMAEHWDDGAAALEGLPVSERMRLSVHHVAGAGGLPGSLRAALEHWFRTRGIQPQALAAALGEPRRYAAVSLRLARELAPREPRVDRQAPTGHPPSRRNPAPSGSNRPVARRRRPAGAMPASSSGSLPVEGVPKAPGYRVFTTAHDETVRPGHLVSAHELAALRRRLEETAPENTRLVARLARRLERHLRTHRPQRWREADQAGRLDPRRLSRLVTDPAGTGVYRERAPAPTRGTVVTLLVDNSASMRGRRIMMAALCCDLLARSLERCGVKTEILGYTTVSWEGGPAAADWHASGRPDAPGRLNARRHIIYKGADQPWRRARTELGLMLRDELLKENLDGEALLWAAHRLARRPERRRILIVIGDGAPRDRATAAANGDGYLLSHLESAIAGIERAGQVELLAVGIGQSVARLYRHSVTVRNVDTLAPALTDELAGALAGASSERFRPISG